jgi:hypothetical protein
MVLLERYLHAVGNHLPAKQRDDIITELGEDLRAQFEDRAQHLGRALTEAEEADLLKPYGRPLLMAARYWPQRYLIGPHVFPFYWTTLKLALAVALAVHAAIVIGLTIAGRPLRDAAETLFNYPGAAVTIFMWVTAAFAAFEFAIGQVKVSDEWDPRKLPRETTLAPRASRLEAGFELVIGALFILWWSALPRSPYLLFGPGAEFLALSPTWDRLYVPVLVIALVSILLKSVTIVRPDWLTFRFVSGLISSAAGLAVVATFMRAGEIVIPAAATTEAETLARAMNLALRISSPVVMVAIAFTTGVDARRFLRARTRLRGERTAGAAGETYQ